MIDDLIKQHSGEITNLLKEKYGLNAEQASSSSNSITDAIGNVLNNKLGSGNLDFNTIMDLFNTSTDNKSSSMFSQLSETNNMHSNTHYLIQFIVHNIVHKN